RGRGRGAGGEREGEVVGRADADVAGDRAGAAEDGLWDGRRRYDLVVEHDGERAPDVLLRHLGEAARAVVVEAEGDDRLAGTLVEAGLGVGQVLARHHDLLLDQVGLLSFLRRAVEKL